MKNYCLSDFIICEEYYENYVKVKAKEGKDFYYIKKYININLDIKKVEEIQNLINELSEITKLKLNGFFINEKDKDKDLYLIYDYFEGKLVCDKNEFQNYEPWFIAKNILEIFEKLSEKGIKFHKNNASIDIFEIKLNEVKMNIFDLIRSGLEENNKIDDNNNGILFSIGVILDKIIDNNYVFKGFINDLMNDKIDITISKKIFDLFLRYSIDCGNPNSEIINYKEYIYIGSLKNDEPDGKGVLINEFGIIYKGEFKEGKIFGKGKSFLYYNNNRNTIKNTKPFSNFFPCSKNQGSKIINKNKYLLKIYEGTFESLIKNGKYIEYDKNYSKIFEGDFKNDKKDGKGIKYNNDGRKVYVGEYKDDKKNGRGTEYDYSGKIYEGEYKNDIREGKGIEFNNGNKVYEGDFQNGKRNGTGILYINGEIKRYEGNFENNNFHGNGKLFYDNGKIQYIGNFDKGFFFNEGYYYDISGERIKVLNGLPLINNKFPKKFLIYYNSGKIHYNINLKSIKNCELNGKEFASNEKLIYSGNFKTPSMYGKEKENINFENFKNSSTYICLLKDGNGIRYDSGGNVEYKGEFKFDCYNGKGILYSYTYNNDCYIKYDGSFLNGKYHGEGIEYFDYSKIKKYEGKFKNGIYDGKGIKYKSTGEEEFKGIFKDGYLISGTQNTDSYIGEIMNGISNGKGKKYIDKKLRFDGIFKNNKFAEGVVYNANNKKFFEGKISDDNKIEGKFYGEDGNFEGKFEDFCKVSDYIINFTNTCEILFEGEYKNGMKCGIGKDYISGYEGEFLYDIYHGKGKYISNNIEGEFKNGKKTGYWKESNFEGEYRDGLKNGKGTENSWTGFYVNNYLHGIRQKEEQIKLYYFGEEVNILNLKVEENCIYFNGLKEYEGDIKNNKKDGKGIEYYKNNKKRYEGMFKNGKHHGNGKEYYDNEILKYDGEFNNGVYDKKGIEYDETGKIIYEGEFKNGKYHGKGKLYRNGKLIYEGDFVDNKLQGKGKEYDEEGKVLYSGEFANNYYEGFGSRYLLKPYEGYWSKNRPARLKQGFYYIGKYLKLIDS